MDRHSKPNGSGRHAAFTALNGRGRITTAQMGGEPVGRELSIRFDRGPSAASAARNALVALEPRVDARCLDDIRLLVSELVTNAVRHAGGKTEDPVQLDVTIEAPRVHVEVADAGAGFDPEPRDDEMSRPGGWGLYLVDRIADRWGVIRNTMNRVWFEVNGAV